MAIQTADSRGDHPGWHEERYIWDPKTNAYFNAVDAFNRGINTPSQWGWKDAQGHELSGRGGLPGGQAAPGGMLSAKDYAPMLQEWLGMGGVPKNVNSNVWGINPDWNFWQSQLGQAPAAPQPAPTIAANPNLPGEVSQPSAAGAPASFKPGGLIQGRQPQVQQGVPVGQPRPLQQSMGSLGAMQPNTSRKSAQGKGRYVGGIGGLS
jgi:hypothetical protein